MHTRFVTLALLALLARGARGDEFDRLEGRTLTALPTSSDSHARTALSFEDLGHLPRVLEGVRTGLLVVQTESGNLSAVLASGALRKPARTGGEPIPVVVLERFATFEVPGAVRRLAAGRNVLLFDTFEFDLETGQIVPEGQGGDVRFRNGGESGPRLEPVGAARLWTVERPLPVTPVGGQGPSPGRVVLPGDFAGRYHLDANGQWTGLLELEVGQRDVVTGRFRSDQTGQAYPVTGQAAFEAPNRIVFAVELPRTRLEFDGRLWSEGKGAMAGTVRLSNRDYGYFATREGQGLPSDPPGSTPTSDPAVAKPGPQAP